MRLSDDIDVLVLPMVFNGNTSEINVTLIQDAVYGPTLVDSGIGQRSALDDALAEAGVKAKNLKRIILTHQDVDHIALLHNLVQDSGAQVLAHAIEAPYIDGTKRLIKLPPPEVLEQQPQLRAFIESIQPTHVDVLLEDGTRLDLAGGVRVIFTPGHTPGHISLYLERTKTLIAGDALGAEDGQLREPRESATLDMEMARQSIRKLVALDVQTIVCYHGGVVSDDANGQLQRLVLG